jgi:diketogulonate reductase-like aldo/keto reductase
MPVMAYSPVEQGRLVGDRELAKIAEFIDATPAQVALAWTLRHDGLIAIPKAGSVDHVRENRAAADLVLTDGVLASLETAFPRPRSRRPLEML